MAVVADWRRETDPRKVFALAEFHRLLTEGLLSGDKGRIICEPLDYWPNGVGMFEVSRTTKTDLAKLGKTP